MRSQDNHENCPHERWKALCLPTVMASSRQRRRDSWWSGLTGGTKAFISALVGGVALLLVTGPAGPILDDLGKTLNPFEKSKHYPKVVVEARGQDPTRGWIIPKPFEQIGDLPVAGGSFDDLNAWNEWELRENAVASNRMTLRVSLQGGSAKSVLITRLEIKIEQRRAPLAGIWVGEIGGDDVPSRYFSVDLDHPSGTPEVEAYAPPPDSPAESRNFGEVVGFPYAVSESELEYLVLYVSTGECDCEWTGVLHWIVDGNTGSTHIDNNGKPFRITASKGATANATFSYGDPKLHLLGK